MSKTFKDILTEYNATVAKVDDIEKALAMLTGVTDWETTVISNTRPSIQLLYTELKAQRNVREQLEATLYTDTPVTP